MSCHQDIQIGIVDPCGDLMPPITLGKGFDITETKVDQNQSGGTYKVNHTLTK